MGVGVGSTTLGDSTVGDLVCIGLTTIFLTTDFLTTVLDVGFLTAEWDGTAETNKNEIHSNNTLDLNTVTLRSCYIKYI